LSEQHPSAAAGTVDILLVRHAQTTAYTTDCGLTDQGAEQSWNLGRELGAGIPADEPVTLRTGPARRARETAEHVRLGLAEAARRVAAPAILADLHNLRVWTPAGPLEVTEAFSAYRAAAVDGGQRPLWVRESDMFWERQLRGDDPITLWMRVPLLTFEPPAAVVRRLLDAIAHLVRATAAGPLCVCCTHSGPMRALAAWALGRDLGEPANTEVVRARVRPDLSEGWITYRGATQAFAPSASLEGATDWDVAVAGRRS
jgi:broad specificity phosphatase PhoE